MAVELKNMSKVARRLGLPVTGGVNGGGWLRLAYACGFDGESKAEAKRFMRDWRKKNFPSARSPEKQEIAEKSGPVKIYRAPKEPPSSRRVTNIRGIDVRSTEFLSTYEWRSLRVKVLAKYGARCMCCGASPANGAVMHVDHIKPRKLFPALALDEENLQVLCEACNHGKGNWDQTDWRPAEDDSESNAVSFLRSIMCEK